MSIFDKIKGWFGARPPVNDGAPAEPADAEPDAIAGDAKVASPAAKQAEIEERKGRRRTRARDDARLEREGRTLFDEDRPADAIALLSERGIMFARHETTTLPCLCRRCLRPELGAARACGVEYVRDFVVTKHRVFFYWVPAELSGDANHVRASMRAQLRQRLRVIASKEDRTREVINPFTKETMTVGPTPPKRRINPFTGKPVP